MNSVKGEEMLSEHAEANLQALEQELRNKIDEAKAIAR